MKLSFHLGQSDLKANNFQPASNSPLDTVPLLHHQRSCPEPTADEPADLAANAHKETQSDTSSGSEPLSVDDANQVSFCTETALQLSPESESFVVESQAGLSGTTVVAQFPCTHDRDKFFVCVGATPYNLFGKSTLMNLLHLAEEKGATEIFLILERSHPQEPEFARMFRVIDAERVSEERVRELVRPETVLSTQHVAFFQIDL